MVKQKLWNISKQVLKFIVTGSLLYWVFQNVDLKEVRNILLTCNPWWLFGSLLLYMTSQMTCAWRLQTYFKAKGLSLPYLYNLRLYWLGMFYNLFLPGGIGGDGYKIYLLRRRFNFSGKTLLNAIFLDRLSGLWAIGMLAGSLCVFLPQLPFPTFLILGTLLVGTTAYFAVLTWVFKVKPVYVMMTHLKALTVQSLQLLSVLSILTALHFNGKYSPYLFTFLASSLAAVFPFTMGGLGAREYVFLQASQVLPMDEHIAVFVSLVFYLQSATLSLTGIYFVFRSKEYDPLPDEAN